MAPSEIGSHLNLEVLVQTSRFQIGLIAILSVAVGTLLSSSLAVGYPSASAVSVGVNPVVSAGGSITAGSTEVAITAPADQDLVITDVILTSFSNLDCKRAHASTLSLSSGDVVAAFETNAANQMRFYDYDSDGGGSVAHQFSSGLRVLAGESLSIDVSQTSGAGPSCSSSSAYGVRYTLSGYQAQP